MNDARNIPAVEIKFEDVENYMVEKAKKESLCHDPKAGVMTGTRERELLLSGTRSKPYK